MSGAAVRRVQSLRTLPWPKEVRTDGGIVALRFWIATFSSSRETLAHATKQSIEPSDQIMGHQGVIPLAWPSRPGESHPEPLTEPCLTVSSHTARATHWRLTTFRLNRSVPPVSSWPKLVRTRVTCPLRSTGITPLLHYYGAVRPWDSASVLSPSWLLPLVASPFASQSQVPTFRSTASLASSGHLSCRMPLRP